MKYIRKRMSLLLMASFLLGGELGAKSLVLTLGNGTRVYYKLSAEAPPRMVVDRDGTFTLNGKGYAFVDVKNFFISETDYTGEENTADGIPQVDAEDLLRHPSTRIHRLDGTLVQMGGSLDTLPAGTYIIRKEKITLKIRKR